MSSLCKSEGESQSVVPSYNPLDQVLLSLQMARVLLTADMMQEVRRLAANTMPLLRPLRRQPMACTALHTLPRPALTGEFNLRWIDQTAKRLERRALRETASVV